MTDKYEEFKKWFDKAGYYIKDDELDAIRLSYGVFREFKEELAEKRKKEVKMKSIKRISTDGIFERGYIIKEALENMDQNEPIVLMMQDKEFSDSVMIDEDAEVSVYNDNIIIKNEYKTTVVDLGMFYKIEIFGVDM